MGERPTRISRLALLPALLLAAASTLMAAPASAFAFERIAGYRVSITIERSGDLRVEEVIDYDFGETHHHGIYRDIPVVYPHDGRFDRVYRLTVDSVRASPGTPAQYDVKRMGSDLRIQVGDPDETITGRHTYDLTYTVQGAMSGFRDHDELYWNAIGTEWSVPIDRAAVTVAAPGAIRRVACFAGATGSSTPCETAHASGDSARFSQSNLYPYEGLTAVVSLPKGVIATPHAILQERWSLARAFSVTPLTAGAGGALLVGMLGWLGMLAWRTGRDRRFRGSAVDVAFGSPGDEAQRVPLFERSDFPIEFTPPDRLRPGQVGTILDERANPLDVSATIVDLAVRRYLVIEEIPKHGWFGKADWTLTPLKEPDDALLDYERRLLTGLFQTGNEVKLSSLRMHFAKRLESVEDALYDDVVKEGWFLARPDKVRTRWHAWGWWLFLAGGGLEFAAIRYTHFALLPVPVILAGLFLMIASKRMPSRTPKGTAALRRVLAFRRFVSEGTEAARARFAEREDLFSEYLPYAIVFGVTERWAEVFQRLSDQPPQTSWYVSQSPFSYPSFASSMDGFAVTSAGTVAASAASSGSSGFSGGSSGGGGGGGGGGSW